MDGTELLIQQPGAPQATRLFVGRIEGYDAPVVAELTEAGARILAVLVDEDAEMALSDLLGLLPENALQVREVAAGEGL